MAECLKYPILFHSYLYWCLNRAISSKDTHKGIIKFKVEFALAALNLMLLFDIVLIISCFAHLGLPSRLSFFWFVAAALLVWLIERILLQNYRKHELMFKNIHQETKSKYDMVVICYAGLVFSGVFIYKWCTS